MTAVTTLLAGIRALEAGATPGPWRIEPVERGQFAEIESHVYSARGIHVLLGPTDDEAGQAKTVDAAFIAAARTDVPRLIQALEAVLALADESDIHDQDYGERLASGHVSTDAIRAAITAALGGGE